MSSNRPGATITEDDGVKSPLVTSILIQMGYGERAGAENQELTYDRKVKITLSLAPLLAEKA